MLPIAEIPKEALLKNIPIQFMNYNLKYYGAQHKCNNNMNN